MRAVERTPWAERRSSRHDEMCAAVALHPELLFPRFAGEVKATVEAPCGGGFIDVLVKTVAPRFEVQRAIVEIKTNDERCSAGDVLRQMKWYRGKLVPTEWTGSEREMWLASTRMILVVEDRGGMPPAMLALLLHEGIEVLPVSYFESATGDSDGPITSSASKLESA